MDSKKITPTVLSYSHSRGRGFFLPPEYDLTEIKLIQDVDSFVRQAFKKKLGLMFKEGYVYRGKNKDSIKYIRERLEQISFATSIPTIELKKSLGRDLIATSNAFLVKVRNRSVSTGNRRKENGKSIEPVAGFFPAAAETMFPEVTEVGKVTRWKQQLPDGKYKFFSVEDVVHFAIDRRAGYIFGTPTLVPVIDDIRALRQIEENIELLIYQHLFPLYQYIVGTDNKPAGFDEEGNDEIEVVKTELQVMPLEGGIVTPERHEIKAIGAEGKALNAEPYIEHFVNRVIAGLGISKVDLGNGDTVNKSTAHTLSRALIDSVKDIQDTFEAQWDQFVVSELLLESDIANPLSEDNMVHLQFNEIDLASKLETEKHFSEMFSANGLTWDEFRERLGEKPIDVPEDPEDQDPSKYPEWHKTNWKLFKEPENLIRAVDEPASPAAKQAAENRSLGTTTAQVQAAGEEQRVMKKEEAKIKQQSKPSTQKDSFLSSQFRILESDLIESVSQPYTNSVNFDYLLSYSRTWGKYTADRVEERAVMDFLSGYGTIQSEPLLSMKSTRELLHREINKYIDKLITDTIRLIQSRIDAINQSVKLSDIKSFYIQQIRTSFDSLRYRAYFIEDVILRRAYNYGRSVGVHSIQKKMIIKPGIDSCEKCRNTCSSLGEFNLIDFNNINPFHPGCECVLEIK